MSGHAGLHPVALRVGLCSITYRELSPEALVSLAAEAGVEGIEWGADRHLPPGALSAASALRRRCADAGLRCPSYGSYLFAGQAGDAEVGAVLETAQALGATNVRIWTEWGVLPDSEAADRARIAAAVARIADQAAARSLVVSLEFHPGTLTHHARGALALLRGAARDNLFSYWQPDPALEPEAARGEFRALREHVSHLHVFAWGRGGIRERHALADGQGLWAPLLADARSTQRWPETERFALLEYVRNDDPAQLAADAATLRSWITA